jgi:aerobic-type carbon monoxide dehydrogenase small subunit (CoxS/CutS family)
MATRVTLIVNGERHALRTDPQRPLLEVLREDLGLTGTKYGCGEGQCGACTVLVEGRAERSCILPVGAAAGREITTIEGLGEGEELHPLQEAFLAEGAMQCGYCTPGMILAAAALLEEEPAASEGEIVRRMNGNICRCNGYPKILAAIRRAAAK